MIFLKNNKPFSILSWCAKGGDTLKVSPPFLFLYFLFIYYTPLTAQIDFQEVAAQYQVQHRFEHNTIGGGVCVYDFDKDGLDDLTLATTMGHPIGFYRNTGTGFEQLALLEENKETVKQMNWVDFDNDGDADLYVAANDGISRLYENTGGLQLVDITEKSGLPLNVHFGYGACWGDYNRDGWLDLYYASKGLIGDPDFIKSFNRLFKNNADGTFSEKTYQLNADDEDKLPFCASFIDYNNDKWPDIYIANDKLTFNTLLANRRGTFDDISIPARANARMNAMCVAPGDYNRDGWIDIYITNTPRGSHCLENSGILNASGYIRFENVATDNGTAFVGGNCWAANFFDADNDGDIDLYVTSSIPTPKELASAFFENIDGQHFEAPFIEGLEGDTSISTTNAIGDINGDGLLDIVIQNNPTDYFFIYENQTTLPNNWIKIQLEGVKSNRDGVGVRMELYTDSIYQMHYTLCGSGFLGQNSSYKHFGIGERMQIDSLVLTWSTGHIDRFQHLSANQIHFLKEGASTEGMIQVDEDIRLKERPMTTSSSFIEKEELQIFPNPSTDWLTFKSSFPPSTIEIVTTEGVVKSTFRDVSSTARLQISALPDGVYFVKFWLADRYFICRKLIKF